MGVLTRLKRITTFSLLVSLLFVGTNMAFVLWQWWPRPIEFKTTVYVDGSPRTLRMAWHANGTKWYEHEWLNKNRHGKHTDWNERGQKICECHWRNEKKHGKCRTWYSNGRKAVESTYSNGSPVGNYVVWYENGNRYYEVDFIEGLPHGTAKKWDSKGNLLLQREYKKGKLVESNPPFSSKPFVFEGELGSPDFSFVILESADVPFSFGLLKVSATGAAEYTTYSSAFRTGEDRWIAESKQWLCKEEWLSDRFTRTARFQLSATLQRKLRKAIDNTAFFSMNDEYVKHNYLDGESWEFHLRAGRREKKILCGNNFPVKLVELSRFIHRNIISQYEMEILCAEKRELAEISTDWL